jgi:hypothetical protein
MTESEVLSGNKEESPRLMRMNTERRRRELMWLTYKNRILGVAALLLLPLLLSGAPRGYAAIEGGPPGTEEIQSPELRGKLEAMSDGVNKMAAVIVGTCRGKQFVVGPVFLTLPAPFDVVTSRENLEGLFIPVQDTPELVQLPEGCFSADEVIVGFVLDRLTKYLLQSPRLVIAKVVLRGVRPIP